MTTTAFMIPKRLGFFTLAFAALTATASAGIQFSSCTSGCMSSSGSYATWDTGAGSASLVFSGSPLTFFSGDLSGGVYTDASGTAFTGYMGGATTSLQLSGSSLAQSSLPGSNTWAMNIALPANTYAFAMVLSSASFSNPWVELVNGIGNFTFGNANYNMVLGGSGATGFFGVTSDAAISNIIVGNLSAGNQFTIQSFELGESSDSSATPELSSLALIGSGLVLFGFLRRRGLIQKPHRSLA